MTRNPASAHAIEPKRAHAHRYDIWGSTFGPSWLHCNRTRAVTGDDLGDALHLAVRPFVVHRVACFFEDVEGPIEIADGYPGVAVLPLAHQPFLRVFERRIGAGIPTSIEVDVID